MNREKRAPCYEDFDIFAGKLLRCGLYAHWLSHRVVQFTAIW